MEEIPQGIVAILQTKEGVVIVTATDFHTGTPGGFSQKEAQTIRAKDRLALKAVDGLSSPLLSGAIDKYAATQILSKMCDNGCRVVVVPVGYNEA